MICLLEKNLFMERCFLLEIQLFFADFPRLQKYRSIDSASQKSNFAYFSSFEKKVLQSPNTLFPTLRF